ncbi:MAG: VWFA-related protein [Fibrobacteres bacterium]|nr:VWFA-related protein [Fibrobacterota bacterium]
MATHHLDHIVFRGPTILGRWAGLLAVFLAAGGVHAQPSAECSLRGADTVLTTGVTVKRCLDLAGLDKKNIVIPANVTRIDNTGFSLCESSEQSGGNADIVYVMDQSGSMGINYVWISQDLKDTVYLESTADCGFTNADVNGFGSITIPNDAGTRQVTRVNPAKLPTTCSSFSGDPFNQRGIAFKQAIDFQAARAPNSTAGFLGFAGTVRNPTIAPLKLNTPVNINRVKAGMVPSLNDGTNYKASLDTAKKWLLTPAISPNPTNAVIFLSDGRPTYPTNNPDAYLDVIAPTYPQMPGVMPPVYGIFMGKPSADTVKLSDLSKRTGGIFFLIPPSRPDSLKAVVERILNVILRQYNPSGAVVTNNSVAPTQIGRAGPSDFSRQADGHWLMNLDKPVGLKKSGDNAIDLSTELVDVNSGVVKANAISFTLNTTGPDASTNVNLPGTQFSVSCIDLPPPINPVKVAYIKDTDGDGAGDKVFFVFTRPLAALPSSIDSIYWNQVGAAFLNKGKPVLSFLIASGNTVVIADLTANPYPVGLTSIPDPVAAPPIGILPPGGVFLSQHPLIKDSIGPILVSANIRPFDNSKVAPGSDLNVDTLVFTTSEPIRTENSWNAVLLWSKPVNGKCTDYDHALQVVPKGQPGQNATSTTFTLLVPTGTTGTYTPQSTDCVYLNVNGVYTDLNHNVPPIYGIPLTGPPPPKQIELFRGYPPVVGISASQPGFLVVNNDPRKGDNNDYSTKDPAGGSYTTVWIPPYGFVPGATFKPIIPDIKTLPVGNESQIPIPLPPGISTVQVVSTGKYIVDISIFDNNANFVRHLRQSFGFNGELNNGRRIANHGLVSYLVWDLKDEHGQKAGQGVFIWKAVFRFDNNKEDVEYTKTGVVRDPNWSLNK